MSFLCTCRIHAVYVSCLLQAKVAEFLQMVTSTLESYLATYKEDVPQELADETQFVLALCGIITSECVCGVCVWRCVCVCVWRRVW